MHDKSGWIRGYTPILSVAQLLFVEIPSFLANNNSQSGGFGFVLLQISQGNFEEEDKIRNPRPGHANSVVV